MTTRNASNARVARQLMAGVCGGLALSVAVGVVRASARKVAFNVAKDKLGDISSVRIVGGLKVVF